FILVSNSSLNRERKTRITLSTVSWTKIEEKPMENENRMVRVYLDDDPKPLAEYKPPVKMVLDTTKLTDGRHVLKVVARSSQGTEGIKQIPFNVRNGPAITVVGLQDNDVVDHDLPITINAYGHERPD